jgi:hypothetical protein
MCQIPVNAPISVYVFLHDISPSMVLMTSVEAIVRPAMDRKIFAPFTPQKNFMKAAMNDSFKKGLRNALTGLCVLCPLDVYPV